MNFKEIENCFNDEVKRKSFLYKLKQCGENSSEMVCIQNMLEKFKINKSPRGITQTTLLRHTFQFGSAKDCFQNFGLVCKSWNLAVETTKFKNQPLPTYVFKCSPPSLTRLSKILSSFDTLKFGSQNLPGHVVNENLLHQILCDMKFLKKIQFVDYRFNFHPDTNPKFTPEFSILKTFFLKLVAKHEDTLKVLSSPHFTLPPANQLDYKKLKIYSTILSHRNNFEFFENCMKVFEKFGFPKLIYLQRFLNGDVSQYINKYYTKNSILATCRPDYSINGIPPTPKYLSVKFLQLEGFEILTQKDWMKFPWTYGPDVQYLKIKTWLTNEPGKHLKWENVEMLLEHLPNLKGICLQIYSYDFEDTQLNVQNIFPFHTIVLQNRGIENLNVFQFEEKIKKNSKHLPFVFHFHSGFGN